MRRLILLLLVVPLVVMSVCTSEECRLDSDCDDGNACTTDVCEWLPSQYVEDRPWWCDANNTRCTYSDVDDGAACEVDGELGSCEAGICRLDGVALDGGL